MRKGKCPKCGSSSVIPDVSIFDPSHIMETRELNVAVAENPNAWVFKGEVKSSLKSVVCGSCGFTELYAADPAALLAAHQKHATRS